MDVSIILVSYNTKDMTRDCLNSIYKFTKDIEFDIFIVDNNSNDGSVEMIEQEFPQVRLIKNLENKGFGAANNLAIQKSNAKYIFCLNTDTLLLKNSIKAFFDFMEKEENKNIGACGCQLLDKEMNLQHSYGCFPNFFANISSCLFLAKIFPSWYKKTFETSRYENKTHPYLVDYITGADLFMRKNIFDKLKGFDERFFMYYEEVDLQYRMYKEGFKSIIIPTENIIHYCGMPNKNIPLKRLKLIRESEFKYFEKLYGKLAKLFIKILYIIKYCFRIQFNKQYFDLIITHFNL